MKYIEAVSFSIRLAGRHSFISKYKSFLWRHHSPHWLLSPGLASKRGTQHRVTQHKIHTFQEIVWITRGHLCYKVQSYFISFPSSTLLPPLNSHFLESFCCLGFCKPIIWANHPHLPFVLSALIYQHSLADMPDQIHLLLAWVLLVAAIQKVNRPFLWRT